MVRTTVVLEESLFKKIKELAFKKQETLKNTVIDLLQKGLQYQKPVKNQPKLRLKTFEVK